jgi:ribosomal protein L7Ae-like RNA K-turn-binding protein
VNRRAAPDAATRLLSGVGLAARAGRLKIGYDAVKAAVSRGEAVAVLVAGDAPESLKRKVKRILESQSVPSRIVLSGDLLGQSVGRERVVVLAVTDGSLGRQVISLAEELQG